MSAQCDRNLPIDWEVLLPAGPALAHHAGCILRNTFYVHGGVTQHRSLVPSNKLYSLDLNVLIWNEVRVPGSPALSHHTCVTLENRYMVLIGGWDGQKRLSQVYVFDVEEKQWLFPTDNGFAEGAGLSSHGAIVLNTGDVLVVGREGCLRTVEKHGNAYLLTPNMQKLTFTYTKISDDTVSRSGHTVNTIDNIVYIVGGRNDDFVEYHRGFISTEPVGNMNSELLNVFREYALQPLLRFPKGRRNHVAIGGKGYILLHGGETFDGKSRTPVGEMFLLVSYPEVRFYKLGTSPVARAAHVCVNIGDRVIFHGGVGWRNTIYGDCYELKVRN